MPNRFNTILNNQEYVNQHVPLPLDLINQQGATKQREMDVTKAQLAAEADPLAKFDVAASLKTYGDKGIEDVDLGYQQRKTKLVNDISLKRDALAEQLASGKIDPRSPEIFKLHRDALAAANELKGYEDVAKQIKEANKQFSTSDDFNKQQFLGNPLLTYNKGVLDKIKQGEPIVYNPVGIAKYTDRTKEVSDYASKVGEDQLSSYIGTDKRPGYIYEFSSHGKTKNKIESGFDNWYANSIVKDDIKLDIAHQAALAGISPQTKVPVRIPKYDDAGKFTGTEDTTMEFSKYHEALAKQNLLDQAKTQSTSKIDQSQTSDWMAQKAYEEEKERTAVPVYTTPAVDIAGRDFKDYFSIKDQGSFIPHTKEQVSKVKEKYGNPQIGSKQYEIMSAELAQGALVPKAGYLDINQMPESAKNFALSGLKAIDKKLYEKVNSGGKLTDIEKEKVMPMLKQVSDVVAQDLKQSSTVIGLDDKEAQRTNLDLFGGKENTVKSLGTGNAANLRFYIPSSNETLTLSELKEKYGEKEEVNIRGKFSADNPYSFITNDDLFADAKQLNIGGDQIIVSGPKEYIDPSTGSTNNPENNKLKRTKEANKIYQTKFSVLPEEKVIYNTPVKIGFVPDNLSDRSKGKFVVTLNGETTEHQTAQAVENYILYNSK